MIQFSWRKANIFDFGARCVCVCVFKLKCTQIYPKIIKMQVESAGCICITYLDAEKEK